MTMLRSLISLLLLSTGTIVAQETGCTLECQQNAPCIFGEADFSNHTVPSYDSDLDLMQTSIDGMHCGCPHRWTGVTCEIEYEGCDGKHQC